MWGKGLATGTAAILGSLTFHTARPPAPPAKPLWTVSGPAHAISSPSGYAATMHMPAPKVRFGLTHVRYYVVSIPHGPGSRANPGPLGITVAPGQTVALREVAANPAQGTELVKIGVPTTAVTGPPFAPPSSAMATSHSLISQGSDPSISGAYCETGWNDFVGITVGIVWDFIDFSYNGSYVTGYSTWDWQDAPFPDGDYFTGKQHGQYYWNGSATGWTYDVEVGPYFYNTKIYWDVNQVTGHGNGQVTGYANTCASGPDTSLLGGWWQIVHG